MTGLGRQLILVFEVSGLLRYLSHLELHRVFQRCLARAGIDVAYTQGYNPRPKMSLLMPKSVDLEVKADVLSLQLHLDEPAEPETIKTLIYRINRQMPHGGCIHRYHLSDSKEKLYAVGATYFVPVEHNNLNSRLSQTIDHIMNQSALFIERKKPNRSKIQKININDFLVSIEMAENGVYWRVGHYQKGTIRVDEVLEVLGLGKNMLCGPISRNGVELCLQSVQGRPDKSTFSADFGSGIEP